MANDINIIKAILAINPNAEATVEDNDYDKIIWTTGTTPISKTEIQTKVDELQAEYDAKEYQRKRKAEYPTIEDCIHAILDNDLENLQAKRQAVKEKYPK
tara:strand:- start:291 stop:590 length:300 start_codon:yes stop_codon:yes gene_type:complete